VIFLYCYGQICGVLTGIPGLVLLRAQPDEAVEEKNEKVPIADTDTMKLAKAVKFSCLP
jgi:hypothetical protein